MWSWPENWLKACNKFLTYENDEGSLEIFTKKSDKQPDTADIPDLESEKSAAQRKNQQG